MYWKNKEKAFTSFRSSMPFFDIFSITQIEIDYYRTFIQLNGSGRNWEPEGLNVHALT